ncbi:MAG: phosphate ABC transporter permease subunit PstC, partial [Bacteroidota bacterium]
MGVLKIRSEKVIEVVMVLCSLVSVLTTVGIILVLSIDTIKFFKEVSIIAFLTDTQWTPLFEDKH